MERGRFTPFALTAAGFLLAATGCGVTHIPEQGPVHHANTNALSAVEQTKIDNLGRWAARKVTQRVLKAGRMDRDRGNKGTVAHQLLQSSKASSGGGLSMAGTDVSGRNSMNILFDDTDRDVDDVIKVHVEREAYSLDGGVLTGREQSATIAKLPGAKHWTFQIGVNPDGPQPPVGSIIGESKEPVPANEVYKAAKIFVHFAMTQTQYVQRQS